MYYQEEAEKKERRKIIAVATAAVVLILILLVAIIVVAINKSEKTDLDNSGTNGYLAISEEEDSKDEPDNRAEATKPETKSEEADSSTIGAITTNVATTTTSSSAKREEVSASTTPSSVSSVPNTGPEEALPVALMAGMLVAYLSSKKLAKKEA